MRARTASAVLTTRSRWPAPRFICGRSRLSRARPVRARSSLAVARLNVFYCQNHEISTGNFALRFRLSCLVEIMLELQDQGANNINLVTATHYAHLLPAVIAAARARGLVIPIVYNTSGYERASAVAGAGRPGRCVAYRL